MSSTILVVEDEPAIAELIDLTLKRNGHQTICAGSVEDAIRLIDHALPDLAIIDWMLPGASGIELIKRLRSTKRTQSIPVIMLTAKADEADKLAGLDTGADDYVTKPFSPKELLARIKAVLRRRAPQLTDDIVETNGLRVDPAQHRVSLYGETVHMGPSEFRLLHFFMTHPERVYTRAQLLDQVWGDHVFVEDRTVDVHIRRLRQTLERSGHDDYIQTVRGAGYRFSKP
ncbi:MAG: phosphate regulon transcriptional regulator PhoB [Proteobacteria bacterium]|nr:phosphate regulon transcriptional regulator PhoB [Pseudomonadota bacterium]MDA1331487.1 phosphate regulon transcriptional regulator PhoB [Pseudomonadota bacterium]